MAQLNDLNLVNLTTQSNIKSTLSSIHYAQKMLCDYILAKELVVSNFKVLKRNIIGPSSTSCRISDIIICYTKHLSKTVDILRQCLIFIASKRY